MLLMRCSHSYTLNKNAFSLHLNMSSPTSESRSSAGRRSTNAVLDGETALANSSWCGEQPVDRSQQTGDVGRRQFTLAGSTPGAAWGHAVLTSSSSSSFYLLKTDKTQLVTQNEITKVRAVITYLYTVIAL